MILEIKELTFELLARLLRLAFDEKRHE